MLKGIAISKGYAIAKAIVYQKRTLAVDDSTVVDTENEVKRLDLCIEKSKNQLETLIQSLPEDDESKKAILSAQIQMLEDDAFLEIAQSNIWGQNLNAEMAIENACSHFYDLFQSLDDEYLKARAIDLRDVTNRVLENLIYGNYTSNLNVDSECIVIAHELTPSETVMLDRDRVLGFVTQEGTRTSHVAILAKSMNIPSVSGIDVYEEIQPGDEIAIDGINGYVYVNPDKETIDEISLSIAEYNQEQELAKRYIGKKVRTKDGREIDLFANIGGTAEAQMAKKNDAEGIGLFRTEFLYMNTDTLPSEDEQFRQYRSVLQTMDSKPVIIRTLDIGGDKQTKCIDIRDEKNPFLGYRAIRLCLDNRDLFRTQLRAQLRASAFGKMKIMFPMISCYEELSEAKKILHSVMDELDAESIGFDREIEIGMMIETPASVFMAQDFAGEVDFFSIGTNDLLQYTMAADRNNPQVAYLNSDRNPVIWHMIKHTIDVAHSNNIWIGICGEIANSIENARILTAMGVDELSVSPNNILPIRGALIGYDEDGYKLKVEELIKAKTVKQVEEILD